MTEQTKTRVKQVGGIVGGLVAAYFLFTFLFSVSAALGWGVFVVLLAAFTVACFGYNPFTKKEVAETSGDTTKEDSNTKSMSVQVEGIDKLPAEVVVSPSDSKGTTVILNPSEDQSLNSGQAHI